MVTCPATFLVGDARVRMAGLEDGSFDLILSSLPFLALRSYLPDGHPDKAKEIGSEATPAEFLDVLLALTAEWGRLLAPHGSIAIGWQVERTTVGWSDCGHGTWRPGRILDPFVGSGTTLAVATGMARDATGIDIDERNAVLALERVGMFLTIDERRPVTR